MPVYEYQCEKCSHRFEQRRSVTDPPATKCPQCRGRVKRVFAAVGLIFKGSGFHVTDYSNHGAKDKAPAAAKTEPAGTTGDERGKQGA